MLAIRNDMDQIRIELLNYEPTPDLLLHQITEELDSEPSTKGHKIVPDLISIEESESPRPAA